MSLNYPLNPDTSFESFILTDEKEQQIAFGKTYNLNELVPINYSKVLAANITGVLQFAPLREFIYINGPIDINAYNDEVGNRNQSQTLRSTFFVAYNYWKTVILPTTTLQCPLGIVTEITQEAFGAYQDINSGDNFTFWRFKLKINWFVIKDSLYS